MDSPESLYENRYSGDTQHFLALICKMENVEAA